MKILLINASRIDSENATGITLRSIFSNFPKENILELLTTHQNNFEDTIEKNIIYAYSSKSIIAKIKNNSTFKKTNESSKQKNESLNNENLIYKENKFRKTIVSLFDLTPQKINKSIYQRIEEFKPNYIYTLGSSIKSLNLSIKISRKYNIPIVMHFMDNWQETLYTNTIFKIGRLTLKSKLKKAYNLSHNNLVISDKMRLEYSTKWNKKHYSLMNIPNFKPFNNTSHDFSNPGQIKIVYTGGLHLGRWRTLIDIEKAIQRVNRLSIKNVKLIVYTKDDVDYLRKRFNDHYVEFRVAVNHNEIFEIYKSSDILLHFENFSDNNFDFIKYSISTKISEYICSGKPILIHSPKNLSVFETINNFQLGLGSSTIEELADNIILLINDRSIRKNIAENSFNYAMKNLTESKRDEILNQVFKNERRKTFL